MDKGGNFHKLIVSLTSIGKRFITNSTDSKYRTVSKINDQLLQYLPGSPHIYKSDDTIPDPEEVVNYPLEPSELFLHRLELKVGTPAMLLKSLHPRSLCNGTRMGVKKIILQVI